MITRKAIEASVRKRQHKAGRRARRIQRIKRGNEYLSCRDIAKKVGCSHTTVARALRQENADS